MRIQFLDKFIAVLVCSVLAACAPLMEIPASSPVATIVTPSATALLTETPTVTKLPTGKSTTSPTPTLTSTPAPILINPSAVISEDTVDDLVLLETLKLKSIVYSIAFSQDSSLLAAAPGGSKIKLWNVSTLEKLDMPVYADWDTQLYSRSEDQILAIKDARDGVKIWDIATGELEYSILGYFYWWIWWLGNSPAVSSDGSLIAVSSTEGQPTENIVIWDLKNQKELQTLYGDWTTDDPRWLFTADVVSFSPDSTLLAAYITDRRIIVWDIASGERVKEIESSYKFAFSHDSKLLAASVDNSHIGVFDTTTWELVNPSMHKGIGSIEFTLDDELLIFQYGKGNVYFWNWKTGKTVRTISLSKIYKFPPNNQLLVLSPDGKLLVNCYSKEVENGIEETTIDIWGVP